MTLRTMLSGVVMKIFGSYAPSNNTFTPPASWPIGWWQMGYRLPSLQGTPAVEACVGAISQTIASMALQHWRMGGNGAHEIVADSPVAATLLRPNLYQTRADFFLNLIRAEQLEGNGYAVAERGAGDRIEALHLINPRNATPYVAADGTVFYAITPVTPLEPQPTIENFFPARDVLHIRMHTPRHPLIGETPLVAAMLSVASGNAIQEHTASFFSNMTRPSGFLKSPKPLAGELLEQLRSMWQESYSRANSGKVAVLAGGLEWQSIGVTSVDAQLIESYRLTVADVARVFRVPLSVIGESGGTTYNNTETLIRHWLSTGLGYVLEHVELALDRLFNLPPNEYLAFDVDTLLRYDFQARVDGLVRGIQGGLFSPNEARGKEGLGYVEFGDEPRLQAQVVPLSFAGRATPTAPSAPAATTGSFETKEQRAALINRALARLTELNSDAA